MQSLQFFNFHIEVPWAGPAEIHGASQTSLKVSPAVAMALDGQAVQYIHDESAMLKDASGRELPPGPFCANKIGRNHLELWDSEDSLRTHNTFSFLDGSRSHAGRQNFTAIHRSAGLGRLSLVSPIGRGIAEFERSLRASPDLRVELNGSCFWSFADLPNVEIETSQFIPDTQQADTGLSGQSDESSESSSSD